MAKTVKFTISDDASTAVNKWAVVDATSKLSNTLLYRFVRPADDGEMTDEEIVTSMDWCCPQNINMHHIVTQLSSGDYQHRLIATDVMFFGTVKTIRYQNLKNLSNSEHLNVSNSFTNYISYEQDHGMGQNGMSGAMINFINTPATFTNNSPSLINPLATIEVEYKGQIKSKSIAWMNASYRPFVYYINPTDGSNYNISMQVGKTYNLIIGICGRIANDINPVNVSTPVYNFVSGDAAVADISFSKNQYWLMKIIAKKRGQLVFNFKVTSSINSQNHTEPSENYTLTVS